MYSYKKRQYAESNYAVNTNNKVLISFYYIKRLGFLVNNTTILKGFLKINKINTSLIEDFNF